MGLLFEKASQFELDAGFLPIVDEGPKISSCQMMPRGKKQIELPV